MIIKSLSFVAITLAPLVLNAVPAFAAEPSYTMEDVTACSQDAMKLCREKLPDLDKIEACMKANYESLRPACKARFDKQEKEK